MIDLFCECFQYFYNICEIYLYRKFEFGIKFTLVFLRPIINSRLFSREIFVLKFYILIWSNKLLAIELYNVSIEEKWKFCAWINFEK